MDGKGIWDLIAKLAMPKNDGDSANQNKNFSDQNSPPLNESSSSFPQERPNAKSENQNMKGSFLKSYNPFDSPLIDKPQITSPRAEKPPRKSIDLNGSKNVFGENRQDKTRDIVTLINRHNYYSKKLNSKPPR